MSYSGFIVVVDKLRPHPNADKLNIATFFGNDVCVGKDIWPGEIGVYFPCDGQLSEEFCRENNLVRKKDENGNNIGGYMDPEKRNVTAIRLRGEKSDGLYCSLSCLTYTGVNMDDLEIGEPVTIINGHEICKKYIPLRQTRNGSVSSGNRTRKHKVPVAPLFAEHADTEQLAYNLGVFKPGDEIEITLKMHGTSQRTGYLPTFAGYSDSWFCNLRNKIWFYFNKLTHKNDLHTTLDSFKHDGDPRYEMNYVTGTRRTVLDNYSGGFYGDNAFREKHAKKFEGKLQKGETVYYEVVGFTNTGAPIMASANNSKMNDKEFIKQYGKETVFSYGCSPTREPDIEAQENENGYLPHLPQSDIYVYRMTMTNEDGYTVEYTPDFMRYRCEQMGIKTVPVFAKVYIKDDTVIAHHADGTCSGGKIPDGWTIGDAVKDIAEKFYDGPDPIGKNHVREGVVVRIINRPKFCAFKHKNFAFKVLEGLIKAEAKAPDMEESQECDKEAENE